MQILGTSLIFPDQLMISKELTKFLNSLNIDIRAKTFVRDIDDEIIGVITTQNDFYEFSNKELKKIKEAIENYDINKIGKLKNN